MDFNKFKKELCSQVMATLKDDIGMQEFLYNRFFACVWTLKVTNMLSEYEYLEICRIISALYHKA